MSLDKYGTGQDPYCYPDSHVLRNRFDIRDETRLAAAEGEITLAAASEVEFAPPPYDLLYFCNLHRLLFCDIYDWAGEIRTIDISKGHTRFCSIDRIVTEADKLFLNLATDNYLAGMHRSELIDRVAEFYGDLNVVHPFREGNGRAQRLLFEHIIINAGFEIDWWQVDEEEWLCANIAAVSCDYRLMTALFTKCIGQRINAESGDTEY